MGITGVNDRGNMNFHRFGVILIIYMLTKKTTSMFSRPIVSDLTAFISLASLLCGFLHQTLLSPQKKVFFLIIVS